MNTPAYIEIVFENVESIVLKYDRFQKLEIGPLVKVGEDRSTDTFFTDSVHMEITYNEPSELAYDPDKYTNPLGMFIHNPDSNHVADRPDILGRILLSPDITSIDYLDEDGREISSVIVPWSEEDPYENEFMTTSVKKDHLQVTIREK